MENNAEPNKAIEADVDRQIADRQKNIPGWGVDADPENDPTYPMKKWNGADHQRFNYDKPEQQPINIEVLHSIERPGITRVFGDAAPPAGLSGAIRRFAFRYSESTYKHWVPLVVADRVGVVEGIIDDLRHGIVPNLFAEKGWNAEWKYNRKNFVTKLVVTALVATTFVALLSGKNKRKKAWGF